MTHSSVAHDPVVSSETHDIIDIDLKAFFLMLWRRKFLLLCFIVAGFCLSYYAAQSLPASYTARTLVLLNGPLQSGAGLAGASGFNGVDDSYIAGEMQIMQSRVMGRLLVRRFGLYQPTGNELLPDAAGFNARGLHDLADSGFKSLSVGGYVSEQFPLYASDSEFERVVTDFLKGLSVRSVSGSSIVHVEYTSDDPKLAARYANSVIDLYIEKHAEEQLYAIRRLNAWYEHRLKALRVDMQRAEQAVQDYKRAHQIVDGQKQTLSAQQITGVNERLVQARTDIAVLQVKLRQLQSLDQGGFDIDRIPAAISAPAVMTLRSEYDQLKANQSDLESRYGPKHPRMIQIQSELNDVRAALKQELELVQVHLQEELELAQIRMSALRGETSELSDQNLQDTGDLVGLRVLEREATAIAEVYNKLLASYKSNDTNDGMKEPRARVISRAVSPYAPTAPNRKLIILLGTFLSTCLGVALVIILSRMDKTLRSSAQVEALLGIPCYGVIPTVPGVQGPALSEYVVKNPGSLVAEAVRTLRTVMRLRSRPDEARVVSMTSSFSGEGKTMLSTWMGRASAKAGEKVIVLDCDLRRPNIHRTLGVENSVSLVEYLTGETELQDIIQKDSLSGMHMIYARAVPHNAMYLIGSDKMKALVDDLRKIYDLVIIDTPACLAVSDARVLATLSDITLYGVAWAQTPRDALRNGVKQFTDIGAPVATFLMNVDVERQARYGYAESVYYYRDET